VHPEVVGNGARRLRRFNVSTPLRSGNLGVFPIQTPKRAEARAPSNTNNMGMRGLPCRANCRVCPEKSAQDEFKKV